MEGGPEPGSKQTPATPETGLRKQLSLANRREVISVQQEKGHFLQKLQKRAARPGNHNIYRYLQGPSTIYTRGLALIPGSPPRWDLGRRSKPN